MMNSNIQNEPKVDKVEIERVSFYGGEEVWYKIPSGFPGMSILVEESSVDGLSAKLVKSDRIQSKCTKERY